MIQNVLVSLITTIFLASLIYYYFLLFYKPVKPPIKKKFTSITIIMPAHNEEAYIKEAINYAKKAVYSGKKQIIVVDDGSTDRTAEIVKKIKGIKFIQNNHSGKSASINKALKYATGELIAIVDSDSCIEKNALVELSRELGRKDVVAATGIVKVKNRRKFLCMWPHIEQLYNSMIRYMISKINANIVTPGALSIYRTKQLKEIGGFSTEGYCEDTDVTIRLIRKGYKVSFCEKAISETYNPHTLKEFVKQRVRLSRGLVNILKKHLKINKTYIDVLTLPLLLFSYVQAAIMGSFTLYQITTGYITYYFSQGVIFNLSVVNFFIDWLSIIGFIKWVGNVLLGNSPLSFVTLIGIMATLLSYPLYFVAIFKFDKKFDFWHLIPVLFMFPFWLVLMVFYILAVPEIFNKHQKNIWNKND